MGSCLLFRPFFYFSRSDLSLFHFLFRPRLDSAVNLVFMASRIPSHRLSWRFPGSYGDRNVLVLFASVSFGPDERGFNSLARSFRPTRGGIKCLEISVPLTIGIIWPRSNTCWLWASIYVDLLTVFRPMTFIVSFLLFFFLNSSHFNLVIFSFWKREDWST